MTALDADALGRIQRLLVLAAVCVLVLGYAVLSNGSRSAERDRLEVAGTSTERVVDESESEPEQVETVETVETVDEPSANPSPTTSDPASVDASTDTTAIVADADALTLEDDEPDDADAAGFSTSPYVDVAAVGIPYSPAVPGVLTFRGSPTRSYYGQGPVPQAPKTLWAYPANGGLCATSRAEEQGVQTDTFKCGTGWTGQPIVFEREDRTWMIFGAYDRKIHFLDADTGTAMLPPLTTGDHVKGTGTADPDGFPLFYIGSRDDLFRVIAFDGDTPRVLWQLAATDVAPTKWNNDWDGAPLVIDDLLIVGGENSRLHVVKLNRGYDADGAVTVAPELIFDTAGWDDELLGAIGDQMVSIETSITMSGSTVYFANSGGLVQGWDLAGVATGAEPQRTFRFWTGDDTDATIVVDNEGFLYVGSEFERGTQRSRDVGQIMKLDPRNADDPVVWSLDDNDRIDGGVWATPAIHRDVVYVGTDGGRLLGIDRTSGEIRWTKTMSRLWQSPVVVDDVLIQGECTGVLHAYDVSDTSIEPPEIWSVDLGGCIESTPTVWRGRIYVGSRRGQMIALAD